MKSEMFCGDFFFFTSFIYLAGELGALMHGMDVRSDFPESALSAPYGSQGSGAGP